MKAQQTTRYPTERALAEAFDRGQTQDVGLHLQECERCLAQWELLVTVAKEIPTPSLSERRVQDMRASLLVRAAVESIDPPKEDADRRLGALALLCAAAAAVLMVAWPSSESKTPRATTIVAPTKVAQEEQSTTTAQDNPSLNEESNPIAKTAMESGRRTGRRPGTGTETRSGTGSASDIETPSLATASELSFQQGWSAFRRGRYGESATWFKRLPWLRTQRIGEVSR